MKFGFRNRRENSADGNDPIAFDFVGSDDCKTWETLFSVDGVTWSGRDESKTWDIKEKNQRTAFKCFGIRVRAVNTYKDACIQDLKMWKGEKVPARKANYDEEES